jgi:2'-5' RNA ligase
METRTIMIFPRFENRDVIDGIRKKYDPLAALVRPHVTLVFPFQSEWSGAQIRMRLNAALEGARPFPMTLGGVSMESGAHGHYLFLNIREGEDEIRALHERLYEGFFRKFKPNLAYHPHMTVGKLRTKEALEAAYDDVGRLAAAFRTLADTVSVETIGPGGESFIETEYKLM